MKVSSAACHSNIMEFKLKFWKFALIAINFVPLILCDTCTLAPQCPDLVSYKQGYVCDEDHIPVIKNRLLNGAKIKTICCKNYSCLSQSWCMEKISFSAQDSIQCSPSSCRASWVQYTPDLFDTAKAFRAGSYAPGISTFIGRTFKNGEMQIGRFQIGVGLWYTLDQELHFENESIEILSNDDFAWKNSSHGKFEKDAIVFNESKNYQLAFYIARIVINQQTFIGAVVRSLGLMYYSDGSGLERTSHCYEVLICSNSLSENHQTDIPENILTSQTFKDTTEKSTTLHDVTTSTSRKKFSRWPWTKTKPTGIATKTKRTTIGSATSSSPALEISSLHNSSSNMFSGCNLP